MSDIKQQIAKLRTELDRHQGEERKLESDLETAEREAATAQREVLDLTKRLEAKKKETTSIERELEGLDLAA